RDGDFRRLRIHPPDRRVAPQRSRLFRVRAVQVSPRQPDVVEIREDYVERLGRHARAFEVLFARSGRAHRKAGGPVALLPIGDELDLAAGALLAVVDATRNAAPGIALLEDAPGD